MLHIKYSNTLSLRYYDRMAIDEFQPQSFDFLEYYQSFMAECLLINGVIKLLTIYFIINFNLIIIHLFRRSNVTLYENDFFYCLK